MSSIIFLVPVITAALIGIIVVVLKSPLDPVVWENAPSLTQLTGSWSQNNILSKSQLHFVSDITAPESMAFDVETGDVYASLSDGRIVRMSSDGLKIENLLFIGGLLANAGQSKNSLSDKALMSWCHSEARSHRLAWNESGESICGRPLGLRYKVDSVKAEPILYILDAYHGLFTVNLVDMKVHHVFTSEICTGGSTGYVSDSSRDDVVYKPCRFMNDLDVDDNGIVYFTDSSYKHRRSHNREEVLDGAPRGRLLAYYPQENRARTLLCGLHFPNGVQILPGGQSLVVAESTRFRLLQIDLRRMHSQHETSPLLTSCGETSSLQVVLQKGNSAESAGVSVFLDNVPGFVDNIRLDSITNRHLFLGIGTKSAKPFSFLWLALQSNWLRAIVGKLIPMKFVEKLIPNYGLVGIIDTRGSPLSSLHDPSGAVMRWISEAQRHPVTGDLWLGSHSNPFVGILKAKDFSI